MQAEQLNRRVTVLIHRYDGYFVDLFVRASNDVAINMYKKFGYVTYRRVIGYYSGTEEEDALGMALVALACSGATLVCVVLL